MPRGPRISAPRAAASVVLAGRIGYGAGMLVAPARLTRPWLGGAAEHAPVQVPARGLGAREVILHGGALAAALSGRPLGGWLAASIAGDLADIVATVLGAGELPPGAARKTLAVAGGSALLTAGIAAAAHGGHRVRLRQYGGGCV